MELGVNSEYDDSCRLAISNRLKEIKDEINRLKEQKEEDYLLKIDLLDYEYTRLYGKLLSEKPIHLGSRK